MKKETVKTWVIIILLYVLVIGYGDFNTQLNEKEHEIHGILKQHESDLKTILKCLKGE